MQQGPGRLVAPDPTVPLELQRRDALLVAGHEEDRQEPDAKGHPRPVEDGPRGHGRLVAASLALLQTPHRKPVTLAVPASWTAKPVGPTHPPQRAPASLLVREPLLEGEQGRGIRHLLSSCEVAEGIVAHPYVRSGRAAELIG